MKMVFRVLFSFVLLGFIVAVPGSQAQQTGLSGVVTDTQGGVMPGARVEVKKVDGSSFFATTNGQGVYVLPSLVATEYTVTVSAPGFATTEKKLLLLVGQLAQVDFSLPLAGTTTTAEVIATDLLAIDTTSSVVAGNVTPKEVEDVPINGRNYIQLSTLIPGVKANAFGNSPVSAPGGASYGDAETGKFQITMDGLEISQDSVGSSFGQPSYSQDAISQFQIITNRFDATAGRSAGIYVNAQTKTGNNVLHGGGFGYFRNSYFNAADPISHKVNDFADQQYGGTLGGKIKRDRLWYFGSYEGEHKPNTFTTTPVVTNVPFSHPTTLKVNEWMGRGDYQLNEKNHFLLRGDKFTNTTDFVGTAEPSSSYFSAYSGYGYVFDWNKNIGANLVNDVHAGYHHFVFQNLPYYNNNSIVITLPTVTVGEAYNQPETFSQATQQYRDDLFWLKGKHSFKLGGEYLYTFHGGSFAQYARGGLTGCTSNRAAALGPADYATFFPKGTLDPTTWNYAAIGKYCNTGETFTQGFGSYDISITRNTLGVWAQDDWKILPRLTLNLGLRYDNDLGAYNTGYVPTPGLLTPNTNPNANFAPRLGFSYDPLGDGKTSVRGGAGLYYADQVANAIIDEELYSSTTRALQATVSANQSTGAAALSLPSPFAGQTPLSNPSNYVSSPQPVARGAKTPYALQMSFGMARELPMRTTLSADFVHTRVYDDYIALSGNLLQNPANPEQNLNPSSAISASTYATRTCGNGSILLDTVANLANGGPGGIVAKQVCNNLFGAAVRQFTTYPGAGVIADALQVGIKHATMHGFTGAIAYTWGRTKNSTNGAFSYPNKPFKSGVQQEWANGTDDQRHTLTVTGEYQWKHGLSLSSLYHFGSGQAFAPATGGSGVNGYSQGTRTFTAQPIAPGTTCPVTTCVTTYAPLSKIHYDTGYGYWILERDSFRGTPYNRIDSRLQESFRIREKYHAIVAIEAFNLFNHPNYGNFATTASIGTGGNAYGTPLAVTGSPVEYFARSLQFIGRFSF